jgi:hypothetical protein
VYHTGWVYDGLYGRVYSTVHVYVHYVVLAAETARSILFLFPACEMEEHCAPFAVVCDHMGLHRWSANFDTLERAARCFKRQTTSMGAPSDVAEKYRWYYEYGAHGEYVAVVQRADELRAAVKRVDDSVAMGLIWKHTVHVPADETDLRAVHAGYDEDDGSQEDGGEVPSGPEIGARAIEDGAQQDGARSSKTTESDDDMSEQDELRPEEGGEEGGEPQAKGEEGGEERDPSGW